MNKKNSMKTLLSLVIISIFIFSMIPSEFAIGTNTNDTEYWVLLVPVAIYADDPGQNRPLMFREVDDFYNLLIKSSLYEEDHIKMIRGEEATVSNIFKGFKWLDDHEDASDRCVVYLTTHGFPIGLDLPPIDEDDGTDEALMSYWGFAYPNCIVTDDEINYCLNQLESEGVCVIVDSCYAGGFNDPPNWGRTSVDSMSSKEWMHSFAEELNAQGRVVLMASCEDEVSYSGGFAPYLIDGMKGYADANQDGIVTAEEVFMYAEPRTRYQSPTIYDNYPGEFPLITVPTLDSDVIDESKIIRERTIRDPVKESIVENVTIHGYITDLVSGMGIDDATVHLRQGQFWEANEFTTHTDSSGYYEFDVEPGQMRVSAEKIGFFENRSYYFQSNETCWMNLTLEKHPEENANIFGYLLDTDTDEPISNVLVEIQWGTRGRRYYNYTNSDETGFYSFNIAGGKIELEFEHDDYLDRDADGISIGDFEILWLNMTMKHRPEENAVICGYVRDRETQDPIMDAWVELDWMDMEGNRIEYDVFSDETGFYSCNLPAGEIYIDVGVSDYYGAYLGRNDAFENEVRFVNVSLEPDIPEVSMQKPLNAIYVNGERIIPHGTCIVIGSIDVEAYIHDYWYRSEENRAERVSFFVDDELKETVESAPFTWNWDEIMFGIHTVKIVVTDDEGNIFSCNRVVKKIL